MNKYGLKFHHIGLAVKNPNKTIIFTKNLGYEIADEVYDNLQRVYLRMCFHSEMPNIEIIYSDIPDSPIEKILKYQKEKFYHICYTTNNLKLTIKTIKEVNHLITVSYPKPAILFNNNPVSFYYISGFGIIEILEI